MENTNTQYTCRRCGYTTTFKSDLGKHLRRKTICKPTEEDVSVEELLNELYPVIEKTHAFACDHCDMTFESRSSKYRHMRTCTKSDVVEELREELRMVKEELKQMKTKQVTNVSGDMNVNHGTIQNITIHAFGKEEISHITDHRNFRAFMVKCIRDKADGIMNFLVKKHFDPSHPENHTMKKMVKKDDYIEVYDGKRWQLRFKEDVLDDVFDNLQREFANFVEQEMCSEDGMVKDVWVKNFMAAVGAPLNWDLSTGEKDFTVKDMTPEKKEELKKKIYMFAIEHIYRRSKECCT